MNKIFVLKILVTSVFIFIAITFVFPLHYSFAQTSTSTPVFQDHSALIKQLQALIISLQAQISDLKAKLEITRTDLAEVKEEVRISRNLFLGISGDDVKQLQEVLKQDPEIYPEGLVTGFFGQKTAAAVKRFQEKHGIE
ncbi:MAG: peptidoglycan-binding protein, partial [Patescibacteria group bacterium]